MRGPDRKGRLGPFETIALVVLCAAFMTIIAYTFSRPPAIRPSAEPAQAAYAPRDAAPSPTDAPTGTSSEPEVRTAERLTATEDGDAFDCPDPTVTDGDTLRCGAIRVRLASIDAPEMPGHCRPGRACTPGDPFASTEHLRTLITGRALTCRRTDVDRYGRTVALCSNGAEDLSCSQVRSGHAVIRYGQLSCS